MLNLVMMLHCHQPVGNFDHVFELGVEKCYGPLLNILERYPHIKTGMHVSGPLLTWFEKNRPDIFELLGELVKRSQVELLSGGFFEPLLATIPMEDVRGQLKMMNDYIEDKFDQKPTGLWLTERVWDPAVPKLIDGTGLKYTVVDDTHFFYAGLKQHEIYAPYITEKHGKTIRVLATPIEMRYHIPFRLVEDVIGYLRYLHSSGHNVAVYGDDGEKFGMWPGTHQWVIIEGWLEKFFNAINENSQWIKTTLPGEYIASTPPAGRIYLPQSSYEEMTEWALMPDQTLALEKMIETLKHENRWTDWRPYIRGGIWDNFLKKYDETNRMHKKMIMLSEKINSHEEPDSGALEYLWKAQCNCAYWHGVFGGLYLGHLRRAIHENLINAQNQLISKSQESIQIFKFDFDKNGLDEIILWNKCLSIGIDPENGGGLFEICHLPTKINLSDVLTRRKEAYHHDLSALRVKENNEQGISSIHDISHSYDENLSQLLVIDPVTKISLLDHFLDPETSITKYAVNEYNELGDFFKNRYAVKRVETTSTKASVELERSANLAYHGNMNLKKNIHFTQKPMIAVDYEFEWSGIEPISTYYGCEFNMTLYSDEDNENYFYFIPEKSEKRLVSETGSTDGITQFHLVNKPDGLTVKFSLSTAVFAWFYPIMTISKSEQGFERTYQGSSLLFGFLLNMQHGQKNDFRLEIHFE